MRHSSESILTLLYNVSQGNEDIDIFIQQTVVKINQASLMYVAGSDRNTMAHISEQWGFNNMSDK